MYAKSYKIEIIDLNDPLVQLKTTKLSIKDLLEDSLNEIKGFKYEITANVLLRNHKGNGDIEFTKSMVNNLDYEGSIFPVSKKDYFKLNRKNVCINVFCYENNLAYLVHISDQKFKDCMGLLLTTNENKSHYVYIKDFNRFMCNKTNNKNIKHFCRYFLHCFSRERVLIEHKKTCLEINGKQTIKLRNNLLGFKNHFKQLAVPFKIYADFESILKGVKSNYRN